MDVLCERCGTSYSLDETRLGEGEGAARVRCARCGHVFLVPPTAGEPALAAPVPAPTGEAVRREWRIRRRDGSFSSLRELTTLQRWIVEGTLGQEDSIGLDGENWRELGTIPDLATFFLAAASRRRVAELEAELALLRAAAQRPAAPAQPTHPPSSNPFPLAPGPPLPAAAPVPVQPVTEPVAKPSARTAVTASRFAAGTPVVEEPAFTRTAAGLGMVTPAVDDWEPPRVRRGMGGVVVLVFLALGLGVAAAAFYFYVWQPETLRARADQARNTQLEQSQTERETHLRAAEERAKQELLQSLAAAGAHDAGAPASADAGSPPRGSLELPRTAPTAESLVSASTLAAASGPAPTMPTPAPGAPRTEAPSGVGAGSSPQTFEQWMAEGDRRRSNERAAPALAAYERALALSPMRPEAHVGRALALLDLGRRHEAVAEFQTALELDPRDGVAVLGLADAYRSLGRTEEARRAYQRYLDGWPDGDEVQAARAALERLKE